MSEETKELSTRTVSEIASFSNSAGFDLLQRQAKMLASSSLVPEQFSFFDKNKKVKNDLEKTYAQANAAIAIEMAIRIGASPIMVAQNLYIVHGRPGWSSQFIIAAINASGKFSPLRFQITGEGDNKTCIAWAVENKTGERLESAPVSIEMAKKEGWYGKQGSKWQTMPELMLRYRAASFFGRIYAPDILMGIRPVDEVEDIIDITSSEYSTQANSELLEITPEEPENVNTETGEIIEANVEDAPPTEADLAKEVETEDDPY